MFRKSKISKRQYAKKHSKRSYKIFNEVNLNCKKNFTKGSVSFGSMKGNLNRRTQLYGD